MESRISKQTIQQGAYRWTDLPVSGYSGEGTVFSGVTKHVLFSEEHGLNGVLRYFEVAPGGYSSFERHDHVHAVLILRGRGRCIIGNEVKEIVAHDRMYVPSNTWHQFQADDDDYLGFLCLVNVERDRPHRPSPAELAELKTDSTIGPYIKG